MSNNQKLSAKLIAFLARLKSHPGHVLSITALIDSDGEPVYWQVEDKGKAEGFSIKNALDKREKP